MISLHHPNGSPPRPIGKFASVSDAARKLGITRQEAKKILDPIKALDRQTVSWQKHRAG
jgi:hypothetical protein